MIDRATEENEGRIVKNFDLNQYSLKTALLMPVDEYMEQHNIKEVGLDIYEKYGPDEELYGIYLAIKRQSWKIFKYLWENKGALWHDKHLFLVIQCMVETRWELGTVNLFK
jgi:hypothetical protein